MADESITADLATIEDADDMVEAIRGNLVPEIEDPETIAMQIMERILSTTDADEVLGGQKALHAQDVLDRPFVLHGLRLMKSRFDTGPGVFAVMDAEFADDGERTVVTCSGRTVMAQAVQLFRLDALPRPVQIVRAESQTANGFYPLWLESA